MNHRRGIDRAIRIMITMLCTVGATTLATQQAGRLTGTAAGVVARASSPTISWIEPRLGLEVPLFGPSVADTAARHWALFDGGDNHTFEFSTLALVLIGGLALLLVVR